jgi:hypothetical protein
MGGRGVLLGGVAVVLLVVLALPVGVAWGRTLGGEEVGGHPGIDGFRQRAGVDRVRYEEQEPVVLTYRVCRSRPWPATTNSPGRGSLAVDFRVVDEHGDVVADSTHQGHVLVLVRTRWWPGQCRSMDVQWDQHRWNQDEPDGVEPDVSGLPRRGDRVEPGVYSFEVWWLVSPGGEPDERLPGPITTAPFVVES